MREVLLFPVRRERKNELQESYTLAQGHIANNIQIWKLNQGFLPLDSMLFTVLYYLQPKF